VRNPSSSYIFVDSETYHDLIRYMNLALPTSIDLETYKSASQRARIGTEAWGASNLFCPACNSPTLDRSRHNTAAIDVATWTYSTSSAMVPTTSADFATSRYTHNNIDNLIIIRYPTG